MDNSESDATPSSPAAVPPPPAAPSEAPTVAIPHAARATPTRVGPGTPPPPGVAPTPTRIPDPAPRGRRRWPLVLAAVVLLAVVATGIALLASRVGGNSTEDDVRGAINGFVDAVDRGDLATLRAGTCGELGAYYQQVSDADFADVYKSANSDRAVPIIDSIDAVAVTDGTALAQVTVHTANDPAATSVRSFALEQQDGVWKVCS
ncbi:hypothetical protein [Rhodococcus sp. RD6.2]|uniref:Rv0361 family membrane protein n=1 Tax=Rhodococcus sp. RD6.2 TaxID=260936 RepID=UPI000A51ED06|nr:hypothetical protein [Rhodococcus sp. RD6.2]